MGNLCGSCFKVSEDDALMPSAEDRRRLQEEAAEKRRFENEHRGIKDPEAFRRKQMRAAEMDRQERINAQSGGNATLKWQAD